MRQEAPDPTTLFDLVERTTYRNGWRVWLKDMVRDPADTHGAEAAGLTLVIQTNTVNSYNHAEPVRVNHYFIVPAATYNERAWLRWLFDCFAKVELHECMEFFTVDDVKPFAPIHAPGADPYTVTELSTDTERRTSFRGEVKA